MKHLKIKELSFICAFFMGVTTFAQVVINKNLGDFTTLKVYNGIEVTLIKSTEQKLEITGEKAKMVKIKNVNNTLKLSLPFSLKPANNLAEGKILIKLYYSKNIFTFEPISYKISSSKSYCYLEK